MTSIWFIMACILIIAEIMSLTYVLACFAIGAICSALVSLFGLNISLQLISFMSVSVLTLCYLRPLAKRISSNKDNDTKIGISGMIGKCAIVKETISASSGAIQLYGDIWKAKSLNKNETILAGTEVKIVKMESITAIVKKI